MLPVMVTSPDASNVTGEFIVLRVTLTVTPVGMFMVVKFSTPDAGSVRVVVTVGLKAPSAPVLPLLNVCPKAAGPVIDTSNSAGPRSLIV
jgi:hypothetical protein